MPINKTCRLLNTDLYFYDFKSAYPRVMEGIGWDFSDVDLSDKKSRNIQIGISQRDNKDLSSFLIESITSFIDYYVSMNNLTQDDIIVTQRDGFITRKKLVITDELMKLDFRGIIDFLIISTDRKKYLAIRDDSVEVKGISNVYNELFIIYNKFKNLNFFNKKILFSQLDSIKQTVFNIQEKKFFMIPFNDEVVVQSIGGPRIISGENAFSIKDIDKIKYYNHYFREFLESIYLEMY